MAEKKVIYKKMVKRRPGYLYYIDGDGSLIETKMNRKGGKKGRSVCSLRKKATPAKKKKATPAKKKAAPKKTAARKKPVKRAASKRGTGSKTATRRKTK